MKSLKITKATSQSNNRMDIKVLVLKPVNFQKYLENLFKMNFS